MDDMTKDLSVSYEGGGMGNPVKPMKNGLPIPQPIDNNGFTTFSHGCPLCGSYTCRGGCFK